LEKINLFFIERAFMHPVRPAQLIPSEFIDKLLFSEPKEFFDFFGVHKTKQYGTVLKAVSSPYIDDAAEVAVRYALQNPGEEVTFVFSDFQFKVHDLVRDNCHPAIIAAVANIREMDLFGEQDHPAYIKALAKVISDGFWNKVDTGLNRRVSRAQSSFPGLGF
jgi:hypothetical protein